MLRPLGLCRTAWQDLPSKPSPGTNTTTGVPAAAIPETCWSGEGAVQPPFIGIADMGLLGKGITARKRGGQSTVRSACEAISTRTVVPAGRSITSPSICSGNGVNVVNP